MSKKGSNADRRRRDAEREFWSEVEAVQPATELLSSVVQKFGKYRKYLEPAIKHPAVMSPNLIEFLVGKYSEAGDLVLDPMAGSGGVGIVAAALGRNAVQIEIVPKFHRWMDEAAERLVADPSIANKGWIVNMCGDARRTNKLVGQEIVDLVIFSPPYLDQNRHSNLGSRLRQLALSKTTGVGKQAARGKFRFFYSKSRKNIGNLRGKKYFEAMSEVYAEVFSTLKREGLAAIAIRPLYRNQTVFDLPNLTRRLLVGAGFEMVNLYKLRLLKQSFWTLIYEKKYPKLPKIRHEYVLVVRKPPETKAMIHARLPSFQ